LAKAPQKDQLVFKAQSQQRHDLYKLEMANFQKNLALDGQPPIYEPTAHCHFFHSVTSKGQPQTTSTTIAGHFHELILVEPATESKPAVYKCSPPMRWVIKKKQGRRQKVLEVLKDMDGENFDDHTHEVIYKRSQYIVPAKPNMEAAKLQAELAAKFNQTLPGVIG
jgi:hypothetical protein